jgi:hypothetical protein
MHLRKGFVLFNAERAPFLDGLAQSGKEHYSPPPYGRRLQANLPRSCNLSSKKKGSQSPQKTGTAPLFRCRSGIGYDESRKRFNRHGIEYSTTPCLYSPNIHQKAFSHDARSFSKINRYSTSLELLSNSLCGRLSNEGKRHPVDQEGVELSSADFFFSSSDSAVR